MRMQKFLVTTKVVEKDGCGNIINPITAGEIRRGVLKGVDYADSVVVEEVTSKPVYVLTESRAYYDNGSQTAISNAAFSTQEKAEDALRKWVKEAFCDWYGVFSLNEEQESEYWNAVKRRCAEFADERLDWSIVDLPIGE